MLLLSHYRPRPPCLHYHRGLLFLIISFPFVIIVIIVTLHIILNSFKRSKIAGSRLRFSARGFLRRIYAPSRLHSRAPYTCHSDLKAICNRQWVTATTVTSQLKKEQRKYLGFHERSALRRYIWDVYVFVLEPLFLILTLVLDRSSGGNMGHLTTIYPVGALGDSGRRLLRDTHPHNHWLWWQLHFHFHLRLLLNLLFDCCEPGDIFPLSCCKIEGILAVASNLSCRPESISLFM